MKLEGKVAVVTGGANGIGRALCRHFAAEGARGVVVADIEADAAAEVASEVDGLAVQTDVARESDIVHLVGEARRRYGQIDLFCSNAGLGNMPGGPEVPDEEWDRIWRINVMAHVWAARAVLPEMLARGDGYLLNTASAAALLSRNGSAPYSVTKHAALSFAEWLSMTYHARGVRVSCLCPQGVRTRMMLADEGERASFLARGALEPEQVAEIVVEALAAERFLILPQPEVEDYFRRKAADYERWLRTMRRLQAHA
jgi:NAD(P)-dependent dehydrogenase (short-subunit alcohol dehydrogenase family)